MTIPCVTGRGFPTRYTRYRHSTRVQPIWTLDSVIKSAQYALPITLSSVRIGWTLVEKWKYVWLGPYILPFCSIRPTWLAGIATESASPALSVVVSANHVGRIHNKCIMTCLVDRQGTSLHFGKCGSVRFVPNQAILTKV